MIPRSLVLTAVVMVRHIEARSWSPKKRGREPLGSYEQNMATHMMQNHQPLSLLHLPEEDMQKRQRQKDDHVPGGDEHVDGGFTDPSASSELRILDHQNESDDRDEICWDGRAGGATDPANAASSELRIPDQPHNDESTENQHKSFTVPVLIASRTRNLQEVPDLPLRHMNDHLFPWTSPSAQDPSLSFSTIDSSSTQQSSWLILASQDKAASGLTQINDDGSRSFDLVRINCDVSVGSLTWSFAFGSIWPFACQMMGSASSAFIGMSRLILTMGLIQQGFLKMYEILQVTFAFPWKMSDADTTASTKCRPFSDR